MGRPEKPILDDLPMKALACQLRKLRHTAGQPSYRQLGQLAHVQHHTLSQIANGERVGWGRVLVYVNALRSHRPDLITETVVQTLKTLHEVGERRYQLTLERRLRRESRSAFWEGVDSTSALSGRSAPAAHAPEQHGFTAGITDPELLTAIEDLPGLHHLLHDVALRHGIDITDPDRAQPQAPAFSWFSTADPPPPSPATVSIAAGIPPIRRSADLTLALMLHYIRLCGGTDGDCQAWQSTWERLHKRPDSSGPLQRILDKIATETDPPPRRPAIPWPGTFLRRPAARAASQPH